VRHLQWLQLLLLQGIRDSNCIVFHHRTSRVDPHPSQLGEQFFFGIVAETFHGFFHLGSPTSELLWMAFLPVEQRKTLPNKCSAFVKVSTSSTFVSTAASEPSFHMFLYNFLLLARRKNKVGIGFSHVYPDSDRKRSLK
jgi:hypothetical protein